MIPVTECPRSQRAWAGKSCKRSPCTHGSSKTFRTATAALRSAFEVSWGKLFTLYDELLVYPRHDYQGRRVYENLGQYAEQATASVAQCRYDPFAQHPDRLGRVFVNPQCDLGKTRRLKPAQAVDFLVQIPERAG